MKTPEPAQPKVPSKWKLRFIDLYKRIKSLQGDPHYVAVGMAAGIFISVTPTMPFHTILAIMFAFLLKGSKPAAVLGVWFCNPVTVGPLYLGSYHLGMFLLGRDIAINDLHNIALPEIMAKGADVAVAMVVGGTLLGIGPAIGAYFLTFHIFRKIRARHKRAHATDGTGPPDTNDPVTSIQNPNTDDTRAP